MISPAPPPRRASAITRGWVEAVDLAGTEPRSRAHRDHLVTEEPLEIRIEHRGLVQSVSTTMRTPGADFQLAAGFLFSEGIIDEPEQLRGLRQCSGTPGQREAGNHVDVLLRDDAAWEMPEHASRRFVATSSCGVCGRGSIDDLLERAGQPRCGSGPVVTAGQLSAMAARLEAGQRIFARTGGLHAAAIFDGAGDHLLVLHEDVGRHNAFDKAVGELWLAGRTPLHDAVALVSGRISFEIVQKAARAGIGFLAGVSAPSSLAVRLAETFDMTLVGFLRAERFNIYCGRQRIIGLPLTERRRS